MKTKNLIIQTLLLLSISVFANGNCQETENSIEAAEMQPTTKTIKKSYAGFELGFDTKLVL